NGESIARAQIKLMEKLAAKASIPRGARVVDIGCGLGGSAFWLAEQFNCRVTGLTISPVQARMATKKANAKRLANRVQFVVTDANTWQPLPESVDVVWIMESSEHFRDKENFFARCATALKPGGALAVCAWLRGEQSSPEEHQELVATIGEAMFSASLDTLSQYAAWMREADLQLEIAIDITKHVAPTWEHCSRMAQRLKLNWLVHLADAPTRRFVESFPLMTRAYANGAMAFGLFVARKPLPNGNCSSNHEPAGRNR
ncbi:MAG TPA: class I SAM-dependent methyltransferase, partial [Chthoniobacterales bacterium]|nr:class I SAM-dependent methyltransferase [Chthoniobacterales bacterium]